MDAINAEIDRAATRCKEAAEMRHGLPGMVNSFVRRQINRRVSSTRDVQPHCLAQGEPAWWLGEITRSTRHGYMFTIVLAAQSGTLYIEYDDVNWRGRIVKRCRRLNLDRCDYNDLKACTFLLLADIARS